MKEGLKPTDILTRGRTTHDNIRLLVENIKMRGKKKTNLISSLIFCGLGALLGCCVRRFHCCS